MAQASEYSFPFDAEEVDGTYDRVYVADEFAQYFRAFITSGVFINDDSSLQVTANGDMTVTVQPGQAIIEGYRYELESALQFTIDAADGSMNRIDRVVCVWDKEERDIHLEVRKGSASYTPIAPTRRWTEEYKELILADIYVAAGVITIKQEDITDERLNSDVCGLATPWEKVDTRALYDQIQNNLENFQENFEASTEAFEKEHEQEISTWTSSQKDAFNTWVDTIKDILDETVAGKLQNEIDALEDGQTGGTQGKTTTFGGDGSITEAWATDGRQKKTVFNSNGSITETMLKKDGTTMWSKTTVFNSGGSISEEVN